MADAAERAAQVIRNGFRWNGRGFDAFSPEDAVAALMADPALLVDLAIEAGAAIHGQPRMDGSETVWADKYHDGRPGQVCVDVPAGYALVRVLRRVVDRG